MKTLKTMGTWTMAISLLFGIIFSVNFIFDLAVHVFKNDPTPITQEWIKEDVRCFMQGERVVNCETVRIFE